MIFREAKSIYYLLGISATEAFKKRTFLAVAKAFSKTSNGLRCLSIRQPWAWLVCIGAKSVENRTWKTDFRGTIAIHASTSKSMVNNAERHSDSRLIKAKDFSFGAIIGVADIDDITMYGPDLETVGHASGPYCWRMSHGRLLKKPIPLSGKLNLFFLDEKTTQHVMDSDFYHVDLNTDHKSATMAREFDPSPDPYRWYRYCLKELLEKAEPEELLPKATRMVELQPNKIEPYSYRIDVARTLGDKALLLKDVDRISSLVSETYGTGERDQELRSKRDEWLEEHASSDSVPKAEAMEDEIHEEADESEEESDPAEQYDEFVGHLSFLIDEYRLNGRFNESLVFANRRLSLEPNNPACHLDRGIVYTDGFANYDQAIQDFKNALTLCEHQKANIVLDGELEEEDWRPYTQIYLAKAYRLNDQFLEAKKAIDEVLKDLSSDPDVSVEAALIAEGMDDKRTAKRLAKKALATDPDLAEAEELLKRLA